MIIANDKLIPRQRQYYPENFDITNWEKIKQELEKLLQSQISSPEELILFLKKYSELISLLQNEIDRRYIKMTCATDKPENKKAFEDYFQQIISQTEEYDFQIKKKFYENSFRQQIGDEYQKLNQIISREIEIFRVKNIPLNLEEVKLNASQQEIMGKILIDFDGKKQTIQQINTYLEKNDRSIREKAWRSIMGKISEQKKELNKLFDQLKNIRVNQAKNVGFSNYRDYKHYEKQRFDYTVDDVLQFHQSIEIAVLPFLSQLNEKRRQKLNLDSVRPWDNAVDLYGDPLQPFKNVEELIDKSISVLEKVKKDYGQKLKLMKNSGLLDLANRPGKAPGGYNCGLSDLGASFIFMNAVGLPRDVQTILHEAGHAMQAFEEFNIPIIFWRSPAIETAELASMGMEFLTVDYLNEFYPEMENFRRAKRYQLEESLKFLPWCAIVDAFQQWIYTNPDHSPIEREDKFWQLSQQFNTGTDYQGLENEAKNRWLLQSHIFQNPFYYIEYGFCQLGAIALYKNYCQNKNKTITNYDNFIKLGRQKSLPEIYQTAGIKFNFSTQYIQELVNFAQDELKKLE